MEVKIIRYEKYLDAYSASANSNIELCVYNIPVASSFLQNPDKMLQSYYVNKFLKENIGLTSKEFKLTYPELFL